MGSHPVQVSVLWHLDYQINNGAFAKILEPMMNVLAPQNGAHVVAPPQNGEQVATPLQNVATPPQNPNNGSYVVPCLVGLVVRRK